MMRKSINSFCLCLLIFLSARVASQVHYGYRAELTGIEKTGFYKIGLSPELLAKCNWDNNGIKDIRLFDQQQVQVPYLLEIDNIGLKKNNFIEFPLLENQTGKNGKTNVVIQNPGLPLVDQLIFVIKNTEVCRTVTISGSDDRKQWFGIKEGILFNCRLAGLGGDFSQSVQITPSEYRFFKLTIEEDKLLPIGIIKAGVYKDTSFKVVLDTIPAPVFLQKDSNDGNSYIHLKFSDTYFMDQIKFEIEGSKFFRREIIVKQTNAGNSRDSIPFVLNSTTNGVFNISARGRELVLIIQNGDNPPLRITGVKASAYKWFMVAYLDSKEKYELQFGNQSVPMPKYDLAFFIDSIGATIETAKAGILTKNEIKIAKKPAVPDNRWLLWLAIAAALVILLFFTRQMLRDVGKKKQHDHI